MTELAFHAPEFAPGTVWLVGAGPGDPGLLTLHALNALRACDVVIHDTLMAPEILDLVPAGAERIDVGKRGGRPSPEQDEITALLIEKARAGHKVLRLKGGDPFVFGRGAEEAEALRAAGIPFRVVPGVTAGVAGPAYAGIPVTARDINSSFVMMTGHAATGEVPEDFDWTALSNAAPTLVIYMGLRPLGAIAENLIAAGRPGDQPVAVIASATTADQRVVTATLSTVAGRVKDAGLRSPVIIVIGENAGPRARLEWWTPKT